MGANDASASDQPEYCIDISYDRASRGEVSGVRSDIQNNLIAELIRPEACQLEINQPVDFFLFSAQKLQVGSLFYGEI